jgi:maleylacetoacetate isomerase
MSIPRLYDYWRSSASYRVRIALNLLGIEATILPVNLLQKDQISTDYLARNPQGLVPVLEIDGLILTQSMAIIEYLDETRPGHKLMPSDAAGRARVRALASAIACDIHPVCNLRVLDQLMVVSGNKESVRAEWMNKFIGDGLTAFEKLLDHPATGGFCNGDTPTMADLCLVPQLYNARRWKVDFTHLIRVNAISERCHEVEAFRLAAPKS